MTWTYPAIMFLAIGTAALLSRRTQRSLRLQPRERLAIALGAFCGGMIGAKLPFALADPERLLTGQALFENGKTIVFGLVGGYFGVEIAKRLMLIRVRTGDSFAVPVAAAVAIGRLACFVGGCCYGTATRLPWGVDFGDGVRRHPTQLYEFVFHILAAVLLTICGEKGWFRGHLIKLYIIVYLFYRFLTEFIRPEPRILWGLTAYQGAALALIPVFAFLWWRDARLTSREHSGRSAVDLGSLSKGAIEHAPIVSAAPERE